MPRQFRWLLILFVATIVGWTLLLPVVPLALSLAGESDAIAGASTAIFMAATVSAQLLTPKALRRWGYRLVLAMGLALLGVPALAFLAFTDAVPVLAISAVRGVGFGLLTVAANAMVAEIAPPQLLGRAGAAVGITSAATQTVCLPAGLALAEFSSTTPVFLIGALIPTAGIACVLLLPAVTREPSDIAQTKARLPWSVLLAPVLAMAVMSAAFGGFSSLVPIATLGIANAATLALVVASAALVAGRFVGGRSVDRLGPSRLLLPSLLVAAAGLGGIALGFHGAVSLPLVVVGAAALGLGFGLCQADSLVTVFTAAGPHRRGAASAAWNVAYDGGTGAGALSLGVVATVSGYSIVFAVATAVVLVAVPFTLRL